MKAHPPALAKFWLSQLHFCTRKLKKLLTSINNKIKNSSGVTVFWTDKKQKVGAKAPPMAPTTTTTS
jgi:hypothetical protein